MRIQQKASFVPTVEQQSKFDAAVAWEQQCEAEWKAAQAAKPFDKALEDVAWRQYQDAMQATMRAGRG